MELSQANAIAINLMMRYLLTFQGWRFHFDSASSRFGRCNFTKKQITLSRRLVELNEEKEVRNTILHEIAHALVGVHHGHDATWRAWHIQIGGDGQRYYNALNVVTPKARWKAFCESCNRTSPRRRVPNRQMACGACCKKYNGGKFSTDFLFKFLPADVPVPVQS